MQLQGSLADLHKRGIGLAAISYDPPATLKAFADQRGLTFPLLSDAGSAVIRAYGLLNTAATGHTAGIPHPGTFMLDRRGAVVSRGFEAAYQERVSAASLLARLDPAGPAGVRAETKHLTLTTSASDAVIAPGTRFSLLVDVAPRPRMHVYTPDQKTYIPIALSIEPQEGLRMHAPVFPKGEVYLFRPLNEQMVFSQPFRIVQDVTLAVLPAITARAREAGASLTVTGTLRYQA